MSGGKGGPPASAFQDFAMTAEETLTPAESRLVATIVGAPGASQADIAQALKLSARHVRRLLGRERVRRALDEAARAGLREASGILGRSAHRAAESLVAMATGSAKATSPKVAAAKAVLDGAGRLIDLVDLEARIAGLEQDRARQRGVGGLK